MGFIIEFSYLGGPTLYKRSCHPNFPEQNTHDPSLTMCWTWHHHILSVPLSPSGSFKRRPARSWCQCAATNPSWWDATEDAPPAECQVEQLIAGAVHHWEKPSTRATLTRETNHWFPLICWYTLLTLCSVGKTIFENHERGKKIKKSLQWLIKSYCRGHPWIHKMCHFGILLAASNWVPSGNLT